MIKLKEVFKKLQESKEFKSFKENYPDAYLASCMIVIDNNKKGDWNLYFYQPNKCKMSTFVINDKIEFKGEDDVFQKEKKAVEKLKLGDVKMDFNDTINLVEAFRKKKYPSDFPGKIIIILQSLDNKIVWNVTHLTSNLKIWNVKIDAFDGKILDENIENVFSLSSKAA